MRTAVASVAATAALVFWATGSVASAQDGRACVESCRASGEWRNFPAGYCRKKCNYDGPAPRQVQTITRTGANGKTLTVKLDGKYSTCVRDSQRLGNSREAAVRYCDSKPFLRR